MYASLCRWVPVEDAGLRTAVRPRTGQIQTKSTTTLPLEFFDSPDMEIVTPEQRLGVANVQGHTHTEGGAVAAAKLTAISEGDVEGEAADAAEGEGGKSTPNASEPVVGYSRFYTADGSFKWSPCHVLAYDRCGAARSLIKQHPPHHPM